MNTQPNWPARFLNRCIRRYQHNGGSRRYFGIECNFEPTCSEYTRQAIEHEGALRGLLTGMRRIKRCNHPDQHKPIADPYISRASAADNPKVTTPSTTGNHSHV